MIKKDICLFKNINDFPYICVYNETDWDGGKTEQMNLIEKSQFYFIANEIKEILLQLCDLYCEESIVIGPFKNYYNYCNWKDLNSYKIIKEMKKNLSKKEFLKVAIAEDINFVEKVIECNMRYLSQASFLLEKKQILFEVQHHCGFILYSNDTNRTATDIKKILNNFSNGWKIEIWSNRVKLN